MIDVDKLLHRNPKRVLRVLSSLNLGVSVKISTVEIRLTAIYMSGFMKTVSEEFDSGYHRYFTLIPSLLEAASKSWKMLKNRERTAMNSRDKRAEKGKRD